MIKNLNKNKKKKAFTLIELIIVIAIIAILAAVALPKFGDIRTSANKKADLANAKNIHTTVITLIEEGATANATAITAIKASRTGTKISIVSTDTTGAVIATKMQSVPTGKFKSGDFKVWSDTNGNIHVGLDAVEVYPTADAEYN